MRVARPMAAGAEGSGLVRTEFLFQNRRTEPDVDNQLAFYVQVLEAFPGRRVVCRTMDVGADKPLAFVDRDAEENPALGLRGIRLHLTRPSCSGPSCGRCYGHGRPSTTATRGDGDHVPTDRQAL